MVTENEQWPSLPYDEWKDTYATLHMWTQIVGKIALAQAPPLNHSWAHRAAGHAARDCRRARCRMGIARSRWSSTFIDHQIDDPDLGRRSCSRSRSRRDRSPISTRDVMATMKAMGLPVKIWPMAVEIPAPIRFDTDEVHHTYDPVHARTAAGRSCRRSRACFEGARCDFVGKCSPVHFFWGGVRSGGHPVFGTAGAAARRSRRSCARPIRRK